MRLKVSGISLWSLIAVRIGKLLDASAIVSAVPVIISDFLSACVAN
ncbi:hypothetical protein AVEN_107947-1, partial [Araneus ventricosus]